MKTIYSSGSEAIKTVYTYEEWLKEYNRRETKRRIRQRTEHLYYLKQKLSGVAFISMGIITPLILDGDATFSLFALPLGDIFVAYTEKGYDILSRNIDKNII